MLDTITEKKKQLDRARPLANALVQNLEDWFRVELTYTSNAIEGNTLSRRETALVVEKGLTVGGKSLIEHLEATNHVGALDWVKSQTHRDTGDLTEHDILKIHQLILKGIDDDNCGRYRNIPVRISGSTVILPNPIKVPALMKEFIGGLKSKEKLHPAELAVQVHYELVTIHPFVDGNGRTARLLMNLILMMSGYPPAIIRKQDRLKYIESLEEAQLGGSREKFQKLIYKAIDRSLDIYLKGIDNKTEDSAESTQLRLLKIGALAKQTGESVSTLRHWINVGLIESTETTPAGYQLFSHSTIERIKQIQELKKNRLTLREIKEKIERD